ncbi:MAG TPA: hypothetical protein VN643_09425 [Pyrinomonadaceae bacterium]|nr:hypothetical protein [Pyrinomonadaceae bacterium]
MSKPIIGIILGAILGAIDGLTAWFTPEVRDQIGTIVIGSTVKGIIAGVAIGFFAKKFHSLPIGLVFGLFIGALLAWITAKLQGGYYLEIMLPGSLVGLIVGFATQKYGKQPAPAHT